MATQGYHCEQEIKEMISSIKKTVDVNLVVDSRTIEEIQNHLCLLKDFLTHLDNSLDLLSVVSDFIGSTNSLLGIPGNHLQSKLTLKSNIKKLDEEFLKFQQQADVFHQLRFVQRLDCFETDKNS